jgi:hypothetical protein
MPNRRLLTALAAGLSGFALLTPPVAAQDFFGLFRLFSAPQPHYPAYQPYDYRPLPEFERRNRVRRPKVVRTEPTQNKPVIKPKAPGEVTNPVPELLTDKTLRRGDVVMFPDGPRVFNGHAGSQHALSDFVPVSRAGNALPPATRKLLASLRPDINDAWSAETPNTSTKVAGTLQDVETTGNLRRKRR